MTSDVHERLSLLTNHLEHDLAYELRRLIAADSDARRVLEAEHAAERAQDLATECRRQLHALKRRHDHLVVLGQINREAGVRAIAALADDKELVGALTELLARQSRNFPSVTAEETVSNTLRFLPRALITALEAQETSDGG